MAVYSQAELAWRQWAYGRTAHEQSQLYWGSLCLAPHPMGVCELRDGRWDTGKKSP